MNDEELFAVLKEIQDDCGERIVCTGCKFYRKADYPYQTPCMLNDYPENWKLESDE